MGAEGRVTTHNKSPCSLPGPVLGPVDTSSHSVIQQSFRTRTATVPTRQRGTPRSERFSDLPKTKEERAVTQTHAGLI